MREEEAPNLPLVHLEDDSAILDLLSTERDAAIAEATRLRNQIHALLTQIGPEYAQHLPLLTSVAGLRALAIYTAPEDTPIQKHRAACVRRLAERLQLATRQAEDVAKQIRLLARDRYEPLTQLCGVNLLTAGTLAGMLGPGPDSRVRRSSPRTPAHSARSLVLWAYAPSPQPWREQET